MSKIIVAILAITFLESIALFRDIDGAIFGIGITAIAGLGGYYIAKTISSKK